MQKERWQFWIDVGGTFTDCLANDLHDNENFLKVLSSGVVKGSAKFLGADSLLDPTLSGYGQGFWNGAEFRFCEESVGSLEASVIVSLDDKTGNFRLEDSGYSERFQVGSSTDYEITTQHPAPVLGMHLLTRTPILQQLPECNVYLGTTKGTNALLTRNGARTGLVTSKGLRDMLAIGDQTRPHLFQLTIMKPEPLYESAIEINERVLIDGTVELAPDLVAVQQQLTALKNDGIESIAICLMHGYRYPAHEQAVGRIARDLGFRDVRLSSRVAPLIKIVSRGETTVLDAYLNPVLGNYLDQIGQSIGPGSQLQLMTSAGSLSSRARFSGKDSVLSGPAAGVVGAARVAQQAGFTNAIGFDMGGTSTDVSRFDGEFELEYESRKAGVNLMTPMMAIETIAAGGGSICSFDGTRLTVGPESAGANPGPACYGADGPLTITDVNLFLGRLIQRHFPFPLDESIVKTRLQSIRNKMAESGMERSIIEIATGYLQVANHSMASAIGNVSIAKGIHPGNYPMISFGGAGGQHCCGVADHLGIRNILVHPKCSILSAVGIGLADRSNYRALPVLELFSSSAVDSTRKWHNTTVDELSNELLSEDCDTDNLESKLSLDLRYRGTQTAITIAQPDDGDYAAAFSNQHQRLYGYVQDRELEIVAARSLVKCAGKQLPNINGGIKVRDSNPVEQHLFFADGTEIRAGLFDWDKLQPGDRIVGPAIIGDSMTTTIVDPAWHAVVLEFGQLLLERGEACHEVQIRTDNHAHADPVQLEIFNNSFRSIAKQMGAALRNTSISVNVKERLDFSCAIFSETGNLVVNAPHIPVHLGAMSETVRETITLNPDLKAGDVIVTNDPYAGGSHLPDVTVLTPVFHEDGNMPSMWVASRSHHAEIGGIAPGSMPAAATFLEQEGVLIRNFKLVHEGRERFDDLRDLLLNARFPSRTPDENIADIKAQVAANQTGISALADLITRQSWHKVRSYMEHIRFAAETKTRQALQKMPDGTFHFEDSMDDGTVIHVEIVKTDDQMRISFAGTDPVHRGNLNANCAIVRSAVMYVMRCLIAEDIPLNEGVIKPVLIEIPECFLNPPPADDRGKSPAVVGGNVETSQRVVDVILGALGVAAASQGTMNNWLIGNDSFGYYETVGGGTGATDKGNGVDAVHCHMSNTRLTDPEVLESRYPAILREFRVRENSGGGGSQIGGNGMVRVVEFTSPLTLSVLSSRRTTSPFGIQGGENGQRGENRLIRADGSFEILPSQCERSVTAGDTLRISTPGGGGFGRSI